MSPSGVFVYLIDLGHPSYNISQNENDNNDPIASVLLFQYTRVADDDDRDDIGRQATYYDSSRTLQFVMQLQRSAKRRGKIFTMHSFNYISRPMRLQLHQFVSKVHFCAGLHTEKPSLNTMNFTDVGLCELHLKKISFTFSRKSTHILGETRTLVCMTV